MAGSLLRWTKKFRAAVRRRAGARPSGTLLEREITSGVLNALHSVAYRFADGPNGPVAYISEGIHALTGYPAVDFLAGRVALNDLLGTRDAAARARDLALAVKERRRFDLQYQIRTAEGEDRWLREQGRGVYTDGSVYSVDGILTDVTESKRPLGEELFGVLVQWISDYAIFTLDPGGLVTTWNKSATRIMGFAPEEIIGRSVAIFYPDVDGDPGQSLKRAEINGSDTTHGWLVRKGGSRFWATVVITPVYEDGSRLTGFAMIARDFGGGIGGETQTRLHQLADEVPAFVWVADTHGRIAYVNARWSEYTGQSFDDALGEGWTDTIDPDDAQKAKDFWKESGNNKKLREAEYRIKSADGSYRWFLNRGSPIVDAEGEIVAIFGTSVDIDEKVSFWRRQAQHAEELERAVAERTKLLKESVDELESFSYTASHDLRAPLRAIAGHAQLLLRDFADKLNGSGRDHLERLSASAERLDRLIHDLVVYSTLARARHGEQEEVDLDRFVSELVARLLPATDTSIRRPLGSVRCPRSLLSHVVGNVLDNACKFVKKGRKPVVRIWSETAGDRLRLYIEDEGIGIDRTMVDKAFRPFSRVHGQDYAGTGIGLAIVKRAAEQLGGSVRLESELGRGSRVCVDLPRA